MRCNESKITNIKLFDEGRKMDLSTKSVYNYISPYRAGKTPVTYNVMRHIVKYVHNVFE